MRGRVAGRGGPGVRTRRQERHIGAHEIEIGVPSAGLLPGMDRHQDRPHPLDGADGGHGLGGEPQPERDAPLSVRQRAQRIGKHPERRLEGFGGPRSRRTHAGMDPSPTNPSAKSSP